MIFLTRTSTSETRVDLPEYCVLYNFMRPKKSGFSGYTENQILASLQYLLDEGFIELKELGGELFIKIADNAI